MEYYVVSHPTFYISGSPLPLAVSLYLVFGVPLLYYILVYRKHKDKMQQDAGAYLMAQPNIKIELTEPIKISGLYGMTKKITSICLYVDKPKQFLEDLSRK